MCLALKLSRGGGSSLLLHGFEPHAPAGIEPVIPAYKNPPVLVAPGGLVISSNLILRNLALASVVSYFASARAAWAAAMRAVGTR